MNSKLAGNSLLLNAEELLYSVVSSKLFLLSQKQYNDEKWSLVELDQWKTEQLPKILQKRHQKGKLHITKDELVLIMQWKLSVGKFRPTLPKLIASNGKTDVETVSADAFAFFIKECESGKLTLADYQRIIRESLKILCVLRGVGPATASLVLSLLTEITDLAPPFFSDECFIYIVRDALRPKMPIKYNVKEYVDELIPVLYQVAQDTKKPIELLQRGAWALKTYDNLKLTSLEDVELPFEVDSEALFSFSETKKYLEKAASEEESEDEPKRKKVRR